ncbi:hypothetical protein Vretifemale_10211, partial [Volvox reticuliferus]
SRTRLTYNICIDPVNFSKACEAFILTTCAAEDIFTLLSNPASRHALKAKMLSAVGPFAPGALAMILFENLLRLVNFSVAAASTEGQSPPTRPASLTAVVNEATTSSSAHTESHFCTEIWTPLFAAVRSCCCCGACCCCGVPDSTQIVPVDVTAAAGRV